IDLSSVMSLYEFHVVKIQKPAFSEESSYHIVMNKTDRFLDSLTARQYGEVVLPDDSTGQGPDTLASKLSRCKEGMAHFLPSWYKFY
ncbi:MAG: hypothetical protein NTY95_15775, partial [Bacteroidia bacterium]|nr:hypothetical protein [Bacteroidia bacterium]